MTTLLDRGSRVDQYEILRALAEGAMGRVFIARDTQLGRRVALKLLTAQRHDDQLWEARAMAQFNHPHIVTIYGVGSCDGHPYIAMEYVEGESLRSRIQKESLTATEAARLTLAIAQALQHAHAHQVVHGDLKPENVMIGRDGRLRVLDFGLAHQVTAERPGEEAEVVLGTPPYMAPELWRGDARTTAVDMWALGVIFFELLARDWPFGGADVWSLAQAVMNQPAPRIEARRSDVPPLLAQLISACLAKAPAERPTAEVFAETLFRFVHGMSSSLAIEGSPFRGLSAFTEEHAAFFFGRDEETAQFFERMRTEVVLPLVGASGVGKSSFIQAGIIPRLRESGDWRIVRLRPSSEPFMVLAERLWSGRSVLSTTDLAEMESVEALARELYAQPKKLALLLQSLARESNSRVLLLVDQLEEVVTLVGDEQVRLRFLDAICQAADEIDDPVRVVFTVRDDFLTRLAESSEARKALQRVFVLRAPGKAALYDIVQKPLQVVGYHYDDPKMVTEMVSAVENEASALPLLQFCGSMLWDRRDSAHKALLRSAYQMLGGVQGALATHANEFLRELSEQQTKLVRAAMLRLVTPEGTRRVMSKMTLVASLGPGAGDVVQRLTSSRLLTTREVLGEVVVELSHESLVRTWGRLVSWLEEGREELIFLTELDQVAELWARRGRPRNEVWTGPALDDALRKIDRFSVVLPPAAAAFINASKQAERRRLRTRQALVALAAALLVSITVASIVIALRMAEKTRVAEQQTARAEAEGARSAYLRGDYIATRAQLRSSLEIADSALVRSLWAKLREQQVQWTRELPAAVQTMTISPEGRELAVAAEDGHVYLLDVQTAEVRTLREHASSTLSSIAYSRDGRWLVAGDLSGQLGVWDRAADRYQRMKVQPGPLWKLAFSPDGQTLLAAGSGGAVTWLQTNSWEIVRTRRGFQVEDVLAVAFDRSGRQIFVGGAAGKVYVLDAEGAQLKTIDSAVPGVVSALAVSHVGDLVAVAGADGSATLLEDGTVARRLGRLHDGRIFTLDFDAGDRRLLSSSDDASTKVLSVPDGALLSHDFHHSGGVVFAALFTSSFVVSAGTDRRVVAFDAERRAAERPSLVGHDGTVQAVLLTPSGRLLSAGEDGRVLEWNRQTWRPSVLHTPSGSGGAVTLAVSQDERWLAIGTRDHAITLYDLAVKRERAVLLGHADIVQRIVFVGERLISVGNDAMLKVWDAGSGRLVTTLPLGFVGEGLAVYGDEALVAGAYTKKHAIVQLGSGEMLVRSGGGLAAAYLGDSAYALLDDDGSLRQYERKTGKIIRSLKPADAGVDLVFDPSAEQLVVSTGTQGLVLALDGSLRHTLHAPRWWRMALSDSGLLAIASDTVRAFDARSGQPLVSGPVVLPGPPPKTDTLVGYGNGDIEVRDGAQWRTLTPHVQTPGAVLALHDGPLGTVAAGFHSGVFGLFDARDGAALISARLHGQATRLTIENGALHAWSDLGDNGSIDLGVFSASHCELLQQIQLLVPFGWAQGRLVRRPQARRCP